MTKLEWMKDMRKRLARLPDYELARTLSYYSEMIEDRMEDGMEEEAAVKSLGDPEAIAADVLIDTPLGALIQGKMREQREKSGNRRLWIVLSIVCFPIWMPLLLGLGSVILAVYACVWAVVIALLALEFSLAAVGIFGLFGAVLALGSGLPPFLLILGLSLFSGGLFVITVRGMLHLCKQFVALTGVFLRKLKAPFRTTKGDGIA